MPRQQLPKEVEDEIKVIRDLVGEVKTPEDISRAYQMMDCLGVSTLDNIRKDAWEEHFVRLGDAGTALMEISIFRLTGQSIAFFVDGELEFNARSVDEFLTALEIWMFILTSGALAMFRECENLESVKDGSGSILPAAATLREYMRFYKSQFGFERWTEQHVCRLRSHLHQKRKEINIINPLKRPSTASDQPPARRQKYSDPSTSIGSDCGSERPASNSSRHPERPDPTMSAQRSESSVQAETSVKEDSEASSDLSRATPEPPQRIVKAQETFVMNGVRQENVIPESADLETEPSLRTQAISFETPDVMAEQSPVPGSANLSFSARVLQLDLDLKTATETFTRYDIVLENELKVLLSESSFSAEQMEVLEVYNIGVPSLFLVTEGNMLSIRDAFCQKTNDMFKAINKIQDALSSVESAQDDYNRAKAWHKKLYGKKKRIEKILKTLD